MILRFGGVEIHDLNHLINTVSMTAVGQPADVVVWRDRREIRLKVTVGDRERTLAEAPEVPLQPKLPDRQGDPAGLFRRPNRPESNVVVRDGDGAGDPQPPARLALSFARDDARRLDRQH